MDGAGVLLWLKYMKVYAFIGIRRPPGANPCPNTFGMRMV